MKRILTVVDMQNDFTTGCLGNRDCAAAVPEVVKLLKEKWDYVYMTMDTHEDNYSETQEGRNLPVKHCIRNTEGWRIVPEIMDTAEKLHADHLTLVQKPAFGSMELARFLQERADADTEIHFCGVCTGICVISNVMLAKAACPESVVYVHENACACVTPASHNTAIEAMRMCQVKIVNTGRE